MTERQNPVAVIWSVVLVAAAIMFSFALACGMPFAAIGALAVLVFPTREALLTAMLAWLANQVIGFGFLGYPTDITTFAWGLALGLSAVAAVMAARAIHKLLDTRSIAFTTGIAFAAALLAQQVVVYAASWPLPSHPSAYSLAVLWEIGWTNALAFATLGALYCLGSLAGLAPSTRHAAG